MMEWDDDDNDEEYLRALELSFRHYEQVEIPRLSQRVGSPDVQAGPSTSKGTSSNVAFTSAVASATIPKDPPHPKSEDLYEGSEAEGFNLQEGQQWIYPTNYPVRTYQKHIVEKSLFNNCLVSLPTGLGKTFIAAVVMYNFYKWYPKGKIIFMAPTKPLVAQQIENCYHIMGIPHLHTAEMTGSMHAKERAVAWQEKRVFFLTPQIVQNDLSGGICPAHAVKCLVIDEAHKATGDHAYAQVIRMLNAYQAQFRVLALSATPGSDMQAVQKVVSNLMINHIELRSEDSPDILQYTHQRTVETMVVSIGPVIQRIREKFLAIISEYARRLQQSKVLFGNASSWTLFTVLKSKEEFTNQPPPNMSRDFISNLQCDFAVVMSLVHGLELLQTYGMRLLWKHVKAVMDGEKGNISVAQRLRVNDDLNDLMNEIDAILNPVESEDDIKNGVKRKMMYGHPKLDRLQEVILSHFENCQKQERATRAIVFCEYREGVTEICNMLKNFEPLIKPVAFMGQASGKGAKGIPQKMQLEVMAKFRQGRFNTLVSTCVGEEGLDIGEVDLIICFDAKNSPIRQVQRMGRTGRKRDGRIIMLITQGKEEKKYKMSLLKKSNINSVLLSKENLSGYLFDDCPSMLPPGVFPKCVERFIDVPKDKPKSSQQDLRKMLLKRPGGRAVSATLNDSPAPMLKSFSLTEELQVLEGWNVLDCIKFNRIPTRDEFWKKSAAQLEAKERNPTELDPSTYLEHLRLRQRTHVIGNSSDSKMLTDLLLWAEDRQDQMVGTQCAVIASEVTNSQLWPSKRKKKDQQITKPKSKPNAKRGRPRKNAEVDVSSGSETPQPEEGPAALKGGIASFFTKVKKPQFIEDEDDINEDVFICPDPPSLANKLTDSNKVHVSPEEKKAIDPTALLRTPVQKKSAGTTGASPPSVCSPPLKTSPPSAPEWDNVVVLGDDNDEIFDMSHFSDSSQLFTQCTQKNLYESLLKALKRQKEVPEEDCDICATLFPCSSIRKVMRPKEDHGTQKSWKDVLESIQAASRIIPFLTKDTIQSTNALNPQSLEEREILSLIPRHEMSFHDEDDFNHEFVGGVLCGGMGDISLHQSRTSPQTNQLIVGNEMSEMNMSLKHKDKAGENLCLPAEMTESSEHRAPKLFEVKAATSSSSGDTKRVAGDVTSSPVIKDPLSQNDFEGPMSQDDLGNDSLNFFGLSKITDVFVDASQAKSQASQIAEELTNAHSSSVISLEPRKEVKPDVTILSVIKCLAEDTTEFKADLEMEANKRKVNHMISPRQRSPFKAVSAHEIFLSSPKTESESCEAISPVLCSQSSKRPRLLRLQRGNFSSQSSQFSSTPKTRKGISSISRHSVDSQKRLLEAFESTEHDDPPGSVRKNVVEIAPDSTNNMLDENISQISTPRYPDEPLPNFELWNDSLFLSGEASGLLDTEPKESESLVCDFSVREVVRKRASELFARSQIKTITQTVKDLKESSLGGSGFTQVLDIIGENLRNPSQDKDEELMRADSTSYLCKTSPPSQCGKDNLDVGRVENVDDADAAFASDEDIFGDVDDAGIAVTHCDRNSRPKIEAGSSPVSKGFVMKVLDNSSVRCPEPVLADKLEGVRYGRGHPETAVPKAGIRPCDSADGRDLSGIRKSIEWDENDFSVVEPPLVKEAIKSPPVAVPVKKVSKLSLKKRLVDGRKEDMSLKQIEKVTSVDPSKKVTSVKLSQIDFSLYGDEFNNTWLDVDAISNSSLARSPLKDSSKKNCQSDVHDLDFTRVVDTQSGGAVNNGSNTNKKSYSSRMDSSFTDAVEKPGVSQRSNPWAVLKKQVTEVILLSSDDDDDIVPPVRKKKNQCLNLTTTSDEGDRSVHQPQLAPVNEESFNIDMCDKKRKRTILQTSSSNDSLNNSGWLCAKKKSKLSNTLVRKHEKRKDTAEKTHRVAYNDLATSFDESLAPYVGNIEEQRRLLKQFTKHKKQDITIYSSEGEDFQKDRRRPSKTPGNSKKVRKKKKKVKGRCAFVESEAEESGQDQRNSSDGESTSLDEMDSSFINDSPPEASQSVTDIQAKYLQSVKSPIQAPGRFKLPARPPLVPIEDVYSQVPDAAELDQMYANDSFCVDDEPTQYENELSLLEIMEARIKKQNKEKRRFKKLGLAPQKAEKQEKKRPHSISDGSGNEEKNLNNGVGGLRLKRIRVLSTSSSDEDQHTTACMGAGTSLSSNVLPNVRAKEVTISPTGQKENVTPTSAVFSTGDDLDSFWGDDDFDFNLIDAEAGQVRSTNVHDDVSTASVTSSSNHLFLKNVPANQRSGFVKKVPVMAGQTLPKPTLSNIHPAVRGSSDSVWPDRVTKPPALTAAPLPVPFGRNIEPKGKQSIVSAQPVQATSNFTRTSAAPFEPKQSTVPTVVIVSSKQVASAPEIMRVMRGSYSVTLVPRTVPCADFIVSWRRGITRISVSDLKDKKKLEQVVKPLKASFSKPCLIVEKDRVKGVLAAMNSKNARKGNTSSSSSASSQLIWTAPTCSTVALLRQAGMCILFSQDKSDTARLIAKIAEYEKKNGHGVPEMLQNSPEEVETRLKFYCLLPTVNLALAIKILQKYPTVKLMMESCLTVCDVATNFGVDLERARKIHSVLCLVHTCP